MCVPSFLDAVDIASHHNQDLQAPCGELIVRKMNLLWQLGGILTFENGRHHHQHGKPWKQRWKATPQGAQAWQANHSHKLSTEESLAPHLKAWKNWSLQNHWYRHLRQEGRKNSAKRYTMKYTCICMIYIYMNDHAADNWYLLIQKLRKSHTFWRTLILWEVAPADLNVAKSSVKWPCQILQLHEWVPSPTADRRVASDQMTLETSMFSNRTVPNWYLPAAMQYELLNTSIYKCL